MNRKLRRTLQAVGLNKKARPETEVRGEYANLCAQAGELQYKIEQLQKSLKDMNKQLEKLNAEYTHILEEKKSAPVAATEVKA